MEIVELALSIHKPPVYVRKEIVHNRFVVEELRQRGAVFVEEITEIPRGSVTILSAHGVPPSVREETKARNLTVIDATCPLVTKVHTEVRRALQEGCEIILIGHAGHDEVVGTMGEAPERIRLVTCLEDARNVGIPSPDRLMVLTQTTLSTDDSADIVSTLRGRFPAMRTPAGDDICYATRNRQKAVKALAAVAPVILVMGSPNSSNSMRLREVAASAGARAFLINQISEADWAWIDGADAVGVTAGASAPERLVREAVDTIIGRYGGEVEEIETVHENVHFGLPAELDAQARPRSARSPAC